MYFFKERTASLLVAVCVLPCLVGALSVNECAGASVFFSPATLTCRSCPVNATAVDGTCRCDAGFALITDALSGETVCEDCASRRMAVSTTVLSRNHSQYCVPCGGDSQLSCLQDATYDEETRQCSCPAGFLLTQSVGSLVLTAQMCVPCADEQCSSATCTYPYTSNTTAEEEAGSPCTCADGFTLVYDGSCVPTAKYDALAAVAQQGTSTSIPLINEGNTGGTDGPMKVVRIAQTDAVGAAALCEQGNTTACNYLANMCVLMQYSQQAVPCALYLYLKQLEACQDSYCERPLHLPWLYYMRGTVSVFRDGDGSLRAFAQEELQFVAATYDLRGNWKGFWLLQGQVNLCRLPNTEFAKFMQAGDTRRVACQRSWPWYVVAEPTEFYELFVVNPRNGSDLIPVPVIVDYSHDRFQPTDMHDPWMMRAGSSIGGGTPTADGLRRRFYAYDNVGGLPGGAVAAEERPSYLAALWSVSIVLGSFDDANHRLHTPLVVLQYATKDTSSLKVDLPANYTSVSSLPELPLSTDSADRGSSFSAETKSFFLADGNPVSRGVKVTLIVMSSLCFVSAWVRTYGWMRRRQNHVLDIDAVIRFVVYLCNHISNTYTLVVAVSTWYILVSFKSQSWLDIPIHFSEVYINAMLYTAVVTKAVAVAYCLVEQCNADYFVIDWERSKGQLLRENKVVPVSMWRSTFLSNELNELQGLRYWHPLLTIGIVFLFLIGLRYENLALSVPHGTRDVDPTAITMKTLRIAVDTFFWIAVALVMYLLEFQVFYRYVVVHPLQAFVDLCSVSNISVIIMLERQFGFYIHGESIHAHADVSMEEFQNNLFLESQGNLPVRGLGGQSGCQTFEVYVSPYTRQYLNICYTEMALEECKTQEKRMKPVNPMKWHFADCLKAFSRKPKVFSPATLAIRDRINHAFQQSVRRAEGTLLMKFVLQKWFGFPPNVMYMNGPQGGERGGCDLFFFDNAISYGSAFLCGVDFDLFILYTTLFASIDSSLHNVYLSMVLTYVVEIAVSWYRRNEGVANISKKTLIDDRFFL